MTVDIESEFVKGMVETITNLKELKTEMLKTLENIAYGEIQKVIGGKPMRYSHANVKELRAMARQAIAKAKK